MFAVEDAEVLVSVSWGRVGFKLGELFEEARVGRLRV
jgi:hypothetical protein